MQIKLIIKIWINVSFLLFRALKEYNESNIFYILQIDTVINSQKIFLLIFTQSHRNCIWSKIKECKFDGLV